MKKFRNLIIGGIEHKLFTLILITVIVISVAFTGVMFFQSRMLASLTTETGIRQQETTSAIISETMTQVTRSSMERTTEAEAQAADGMFRNLASRVRLVADYAGKIFADPDSYPAKAYVGPDTSADGELSALVIWADGTDPEDPAVQARAGLAANLSEIMISLCEATESDNIYAGIPEGFFLMTTRSSAEWLAADGTVRSYDPRTRFWYIQAAEAGELVFSDLEVDANTGEMSVVCAMPVCGQDGELQAVIGSDLFLHAMQAVAQDFVSDGGTCWIVNRDGHVIYSTDQELLAVNESALAQDLRSSENRELAGLVGDAMADRTDVRVVTMNGRAYYMLGMPVETVGWTLFSAFPKDTVDQVEGALLSSYSEITEEARTTYRERNGQSRRLLAAIIVLIAAAAVAAALLTGRRLVKPLNSITRRIAELKEGDLEFRMEDRYRTGDEIEVLAESFAELSHKTMEYVEQVKTATADRERILTELTMANRIQESVLPHDFPPYPERNEFDLYAVMDPAREVGGDFYDFFLIDRDHLCLVMADVSGKGIPAALFMMTSKTILKNCAMLGQAPAEILERTNDVLCSTNQAEMFVTVWLGILEISSGRMTCANAGHEYPAVYTAGGDRAYSLLKDRHGFVLGGMECVRYGEYEIRLKPGDRLFLYTDGVPEATDSDKKMFGTDRMIRVLNEDPEISPKETLEKVHRAVDAFVGEAEQFDDLTMLCLDYRGKDGAISL